MISNLQILRAFAALNVVFGHIIGNAEYYNYDTSFSFTLAGWASSGVDIFFVISGFVMLFTQLEHKRSVTDFITSRIIRIVPIYWLITTIIILTKLFIPNSFRTMVITAKKTLASYTFLSGAIGDDYPIVGVGWTLEWEMLFYLVFGLSLWFRTWTASLASVVFGLTAFAVSTSNYIVMEFVFGLFAALAYKKFLVKPHFGIVMLSCGVIFLLVSISPFIRETFENRVLLYGIPSLLIVYGVVTIEQFRSKFGELLGDASYCIYLLQMPLIPIFYKLVAKLDLSLNNDLIAVFCLLFTALGGIVMHLIIEKPLTRFLKCSIIRWHL
ncbi:MAG: acyltransferase [Magnetococcus sp. THC-1_WYH]